MIYVINSQYI